MARPKTTDLTPARTPDIDGTALRETQELGAQLAAAWTTEQRERDRTVWQRQARRESRELNTRMNQVADLMELQQIKDSRGYRGYEHTTADGAVVEIRTWEQYCVLLEGRSVEAVDRDLANLRQFGVELYAALTQQGLGPATLRQWRAIPEDGHAALQELAASGDREQIVDLAEELLAREREARDAAARELHEERANSEAKDRLLSRRSEELDATRLELERTRRRIQTAPVDEAEEALRLEAQGIATGIESAIVTQLRPAFEALAGCELVDHRAWMHQTLRLLEQRLAVLAQDYGVEEPPDEIPAWADPERFAAADAAITRALHNGAGGDEPGH